MILKIYGEKLVFVNNMGEVNDPKNLTSPTVKLSLREEIQILES